MLRANVSPSTVTGIEVSGQDQPFGQNAYSRTSEQTYRDVAGTVQDTWTHRQQQSERIPLPVCPPRTCPTSTTPRFPAAPIPAVNIPGFAYFGREPYSYIQRTETALSVHRQLLLDDWPPQHEVRRGLQLSASDRHLHRELRRSLRFRLPSAPQAASPIPHPCPSPAQCIPALSAGAVLRRRASGSFVQGLGSPSD